MFLNYFANDFLFWISTFVGTVSWIILFLFPNSKISRLWIHSGFAVLVLTAIHLYTLAGTGIFVGSHSTFESFKLMLTNDRLALALWIHVQAFDLFVGAWVVRDARENNLTRLHLSVALILIFIAGPIGYGCYKISKFILKHKDKFQ